MSNSDLRKIIERIYKLPSLPLVVTRILALVKNPRSSTEDLTRVINLDQALALKVMRLANSSFYGYAGKIRNLSQAAVILGFDSIKSIALSASVFEPFKGPARRTPLFDRESFWRHSIGVAVTARLLAQSMPLQDPESYFFTGLVHDIGKMVLDHFASEDFERALRRAKQNGSLLFEAENDLLGYSHAQVGRWLAARWKLPDDIVDAICHHHQPSRSRKAPQLTAAVHVANVAVQSKTIGASGNGSAPAVDAFAWDALNLSADGLSAMLDQVDSEMDKAEAFIALSREAA